MPPTTTTTNPHLTDPLLAPFLHPTFSPTNYLNTHLPTPTPSKQLPPLTTQASQIQFHTSTLAAQSARLSTTLTTLTDEILRTSSRLAYEVELLRGEALSLAETLSPDGPLRPQILKVTPDAFPSPSTETGPIPHASSEPPQLPRLRTLHHVRTQLQHTIHLFNLALSFPFPPSLVTTTASSLINITSPASPDAEARGHAALARLKGEVVDLMRAGDRGRAMERVAELREVCGVWRGTGEERARGRWVGELEVLVGLGEEGSRGGEGGKQEVGGQGFLRTLREGIYLE